MSKKTSFESLLNNPKQMEKFKKKVSDEVDEERKVINEKLKAQKFTKQAKKEGMENPLF